MVYPSGDAFGSDTPNRASEEWQPEDRPPVPVEEWKALPEESQPGAPGRVPEPVVGKDAEDELPRRLRLAFAPLHKRAFGIAVGAACGSVIAALTAFHVLLLDSPGAPSIGLLAQYFYGYRVSAAGVLIGGAWAFAVGFVAGWFFAFCRNFAFAASIFIRRTRAELAQTRDFLDHI